MVVERINQFLKVNDAIPNYLINVNLYIFSAVVLTGNTIA